MQKTMRSRIFTIGPWVLISAVVLIPRLAGLADYVTRDEPAWLSQGTNFYYALGQREFEKTVYEYQPAVTTMWLVTAATLYYFPEYRGLGQGYLEYEKDVLDPFLLAHNRQPLRLLEYTRAAQVMLICALLISAGLLLRRLAGDAVALLATLLVAFDPFFMGQSRILSHEAMLALFGLISILAVLLYLKDGRKTLYLVLAGVAAGLAQLTKSSGIILFPVVGLMFASEAVVGRRGGGLPAAMWREARPFLAWLAISAVTYVVLWPGMWVDPGGMLYQVYGNAFSYALQGGRLKITGSLTPSAFSLDVGLAGIRDHLSALAWRTTPVTWMGVLLAAAAVAARRVELMTERVKLVLVYAAVIAGLYVLMFGIAQGRNSPHYILTSYVCLNLIAAIGWVAAITWLARRDSSKWKDWSRYGLVLSLGAIQIFSAARFHPYYFNYFNPLLEGLQAGVQYPVFPYGEGLDEAARYLAAKPDARDLTVISYYGRGCFSYLFPGTTKILKPPLFLPGNESDLIGNIQTSDYLVVYPILQQRLPDYQAFLAALAPIRPEYVVGLNNLEYARVYLVADLPETFYETLAVQRPN